MLTIMYNLVRDNTLGPFPVSLRLFINAHMVWDYAILLQENAYMYLSGDFQLA